MWCTLFIYLCGDLSAQLFVGDGGGKAKDKDKDMEKKVNKKNGEQERGMGDEVEKEGVMARYDPLRTVRHMTVGALAAVPGYKWYVIYRAPFPNPLGNSLFSNLLNFCNLYVGSCTSTTTSTSAPNLASSQSSQK